MEIEQLKKKIKKIKKAKIPVVSSSTRHAHQAPPRTAPRRAMRPARCVGSQDLYRLYGRAFARIQTKAGSLGCPDAAACSVCGSLGGNQCRASLLHKQHKQHKQQRKKKKKHFTFFGCPPGTEDSRATPLGGMDHGTVMARVHVEFGQVFRKSHQP